MNDIGQREKKTRVRVIKLFRERLGYDYLGDWTDSEGNSNIEEDLLRKFLRGSQWGVPHIQHIKQVDAHATRFRLPGRNRRMDWRRLQGKAAT